MRMQQRRKTAATWASSNEVLLDGEIGLESDTGKWKVGDGSTLWNGLAYQPSNGGITAAIGTAISNLVNGAPGAVDTLKELADALGDDPNFATTVTNALAAKANTASLAPVATAGSYSSLTGKPTLGTAAAAATSDFDAAGTATAAQAYAIQRGNHTGTQAASTVTGLATVATSGSKADVGLGNVSNLAPADLPVSTAQAAADTAATTAAQATSLQKTANLSDLGSATTARSNLGLGTAATAAASAFQSKAHWWQPTAGEWLFDRRLAASSALGFTGGTIRLSYFQAVRTETIGQVVVYSGNTAAAGLTHAIIGIYSADASGNLTLVAQTADDTTLFAATNTTYTKALTASFSKTVDTTYAVAWLLTGTTMPNVVGANTFAGANTGISSTAPRLAGAFGSSLTALPASITAAGIANTAGSAIAALIP